MNFSKYHAIGNVYFVIEPDDIQNELTAQQISTLCHNNFGIGSDGILIGPLASNIADFRMRIINPDGSEAEKSGNGLRIFCRYLLDTKRVSDQSFSIETLGGIVRAQILDDGARIQIEMGIPSFNSKDISVTGPEREVLNETIEILDKTFTFSAVSMGNPHCVIFCDEPTEVMAKKYGPLIENNQIFPARTNVQFVKVLDQHTLQIEIWERGAGYTLASGSSSCAVVATAYRLGLCAADVKVIMCGGELDIQVSETGMVTMTGPVTPICTGHISSQLFDSQKII